MNKFWNRDRKAGLVAYPVGDAIAQALLGSFSLSRFCALGLTGALLYAVEIPWWFRFIERRWKDRWARTVAAIGYFNPLWIARHFLIIRFFEDPGTFASMTQMRSQFLTSLDLGVKSFAGAVVLSLIGNYIIQNRIRLENRFIASSIFSGFMAMYYALSVLLT